MGYTVFAWKANQSAGVAVFATNDNVFVLVKA